MRYANGSTSFNASTTQRTTSHPAKRSGGPSTIETLEGRVLFSANLLVNGDFSNGAAGFTTQYSHTAKGNGGYAVGSNPAVDLGANGNKYQSMGDHTTGTGLMLQADGSTKIKKFVWEETVNVTNTQNYIFSGYEASIGDKSENGIDPSPARLAVYVNGLWTGDDFTAPATDGQWSSFSTVWVDAANSKTAVIKIVDLNTVNVGNDFVLDDLSFVHSPTLISNGDFTKGNTGFTSQYAYVNGKEQTGDYVVGANPSKDLSSGFANIGDHTTGKGFMLEADGATSADQAVWQENMSVDAGEDYIMSAWATSIGETKGNHLDANPAKLDIYIDGVRLGHTLSLSAKDGQWSHFSSVWDAPQSGVVTIKIVDAVVKSAGNNFALDDLAFLKL